jgi:hypothetical protein
VVSWTGFVKGISREKAAVTIWLAVMSLFALNGTFAPAELASAGIAEFYEPGRRVFKEF